jgi:hypothetical protein
MFHSMLWVWTLAETGTGFNTPLKQWRLEDYKTIVEIGVGVGTVFAGLSAARTFRAKEQRNHAQWLAKLYKTFYEDKTLSDVRAILDNEADIAKINSLLFGQEAQHFNHYLNFLEYVGLLEEKKQITQDEIDSMFGFDLKVLWGYLEIREYIENTADYGFVSLKGLLTRLAGEQRWPEKDTTAASQAQPPPATIA